MANNLDSTKVQPVFLRSYVQDMNVRTQLHYHHGSIVVTSVGGEQVFPELENIGLADIKFILEGSKRSKYNQSFEALCETFSLDADEQRENIRNDILSYGLKKTEVKPLVFYPYSEIDLEIRKELGDETADTFRDCLCVIVSNLFADTESLFMILLARAGDGKSTVLRLFQKSESVITIDSFTQNAFDPGTAKKDQEAYSILDECAGKTLIIKDLTGIFNDEPGKVRKFKGVMEDIYGEDGYRKGSPGSGIRTFGGKINTIFGVNPHAFNKKYPSGEMMGYDMIATERYIYGHLPARDHFADFLNGKIWTKEKSDSIAEKVAGFLQNIQYRDIKYDTAMIAAAIIGVFKKYDAENLGWKDGTQTRRLKQCIMFCKASALIDGRKEVNLADVKRFVKLLELK